MDRVDRSSTWPIWNQNPSNPTAWTRTGVTETMLSDDGNIQHWQAALPVGAGRYGFLRLQATRP